VRYMTPGACFSAGQKTIRCNTVSSFKPHVQ
jgi:hypothetical protein